MAAEPIRVLCVDDSPDLAALLEISIGAQEDMQVVGCLCESRAVLEEVDRTRPHVLLIDLTMPGKSPLDVVREGRDLYPETRSIIYSGYDDVQTRESAQQAGAWGFVSKHGDMDDLMKSIRHVAGGKTTMRRV